MPGKHTVESMIYEKNLLKQIYKLIMKFHEVECSWQWDTLMRETEWSPDRDLKTSKMLIKDQGEISNQWKEDGLFSI